MYCLCTNNFLCISDIDECDSEPCQHGGVCTNLVDSYSCDCPNGYDGDDCENGSIFHPIQYQYICDSCVYHNYVMYT